MPGGAHRLAHASKCSFMDCRYGCVQNKDTICNFSEGAYPKMLGVIYDEETRERTRIPMGSRAPQMSLHVHVKGMRLAGAGKEARDQLTVANRAMCLGRWRACQLWTPVRQSLAFGVLESSDVHTCHVTLGRCWRWRC